MGKKRENKHNVPRRKRIKREARLQSGKEWVRKYEGKNILKSYAKWFGVNQVCAMLELEMLGFTFSEKRKTDIKKSEEARVRERQLRKEKRKKNEFEAYDYDFDSDDTFAFIAGYTENGVPFGITYEEMVDYEFWEEELKDDFCNESEFHDSDWAQEHHDPTDEKLVDYLLQKRQPINWENNDSIFKFEKLESYFNHYSPLKEQGDVIYYLNRFELLELIKKKRNQKSDLNF